MGIYVIQRSFRHENEMKIFTFCESLWSAFPHQLMLSNRLSMAELEFLDGSCYLIECPSHALRPVSFPDSISDVIGSTLRSSVSRYGQWLSFISWRFWFFSQAHSTHVKWLETLALFVCKVERAGNCLCLSVNSTTNIYRVPFDWLQPRLRPRLMRRSSRSWTLKRIKEKFSTGTSSARLKNANDVKTFHNTISAFVLRSELHSHGGAFGQRQTPKNNRRH